MNWVDITGNGSLVIGHLSLVDGGDGEDGEDGGL
jgi:hypothetical protein